MAALAFALHVLGAVVWVGGMFAIYVCLRPAVVTLEPRQRLQFLDVFGAPSDQVRPRLADRKNFHGPLMTLVHCGA